MLIISSSPSVFLTEPAIEDSRLDFDYSNPDYQNSFVPNLKVNCLGQCLVKATYGTSDKCHDSCQEGDVAVLRMNNIFDARLKLDNLVYIDRSMVSGNLLTKNDILINRTNSKELVGKCALYDDQIEASYASYLIRLRVDESRLIPAFLVLYLTAMHGRNEINKRSCGTANQYNISIGHIKSFAIPELPRSGQESILARYDSINRLKINFFGFKNSTLHALSEKIGHSIDSTFASELRIYSFPVKHNDLVFLRNHNDAERLDVPANHPDYTELVKQIKKSPNSGFLSDLVDVSENRFNPDDHAGEQVHYLAIGDIDGMTGKIIAPQTMMADELPSRARRAIRDGDILVGIAGASTGTENMVVLPVTNEQDGWVATTGFLVLRPKSDVDIQYVCALLKAPFVLRQIRALLTSPAMPTISESDVMQLAVPVTNAETRSSTLLEIKSILSDGNKLAKQLEEISGQIQGLLSEAKSNIFDLLDDKKFSAISVKSNEIERAMAKIEEALR